MSIVTADKRKLDCMWVPRAFDSVLREREWALELSGQKSRSQLPEACAILFHANAMVGLDMFPWANWYET